MQTKCLVCESPTAKSKHFGTRTCKACAGELATRNYKTSHFATRIFKWFSAFFRRAVAIDAQYECIGEEKGKCDIHYGTI